MTTKEKIMKENLYNYLATVIRVVDGDTIHIEIDEGFFHSWKTNARLAEINAPEKNSLDEEVRKRAIESKDYLSELLPVGTKIYIVSKRLDKYGRPLAYIFVGEKSINDEMLSKGFAVKYEKKLIVNTPNIEIK